MKKNHLLLFAIIMFAISACDESANDEQIIETNLPEYTVKSVQTNFVPTNALTTSEEEGIYFMREEELLARDLYTAFFNDYNLSVFNRIAQSEDRHATAMLALIDFYQLIDPATGIVGEYSNPDLQTMYNDLYAQGTIGLMEAIAVGALVEEVDIEDINQILDSTSNENLVMVYENLLKGSKNHLRAFVKQLDNNGISYTPQVLSLLEFEEILNDTNTGNQGNCNGSNTGNGNGNGNGNGSGNGNGQGTGNGNGNNWGQGNGSCDSTGTNSGMGQAHAKKWKHQNQTGI